MNYFVTGATGFIGKLLLEKLLARDGAQVHVLVRESSKDKFEALQARYGDAARVGFGPEGGGMALRLELPCAC